MPVLSSPKYERFAQEIAKGVGVSAAYIKAGYKANDGNASRLNGDERVKARVAEILADGAEKAGVTVQRIMEELARIGFANMLDYVTVGSNGDPFVDLSSLSREQAAAIAEVTVEDFTDGRGEGARDVKRIKFKLHDKKGALVDLGKQLGMFKDQVDHSGAVTVNIIGPEADL